MLFYKWLSYNDIYNYNVFTVKRKENIFIL